MTMLKGSCKAIANHTSFPLVSYEVCCYSDCVVRCGFCGCCGQCGGALQAPGLLFVTLSLASIYISLLLNYCYKVYARNAALVDALNAEGRGVVYKLNQFSHLTEDEFDQYYSSNIQVPHHHLLYNIHYAPNSE